MKIKFSKNQRQFLINVFIICLLVSIIIIYFLKLLLPNKSSQDIATTIAGILGTAFSFFGSILVYKALQSQIRANKQIQLQIQNQEIENRIEKRKEHFKNRIGIIQYEINNFYYSYNDELIALKPQKLNYSGSQAIHKLLNNSKDNYYGTEIKTPYEIEPKLVELRSLLVFFDLTILEIRNDTIIDSESKEEIINILKYIFESKIKANFKIMETHRSKLDEPCPDNCGNFHGIPSDLFNLVDGIMTKIDAT